MKTHTLLKNQKDREETLGETLSNIRKMMKFLGESFLIQLIILSTFKPENLLMLKEYLNDTIKVLTPCKNQKAAHAAIKRNKRMVLWINCLLDKKLKWICDITVNWLRFTGKLGLKRSY